MVPALAGIDLIETVEDPFPVYQFKVIMSTEKH
jgi:hypothetical protein